LLSHDTLPEQTGNGIIAFLEQLSLAPVPSDVIGSRGAGLRGRRSPPEGEGKCACGELGPEPDLEMEDDVEFERVGDPGSGGL
jgi:hypothetical protein